ncbi:unnamed protein product [Hymenolepis diminuta]|uniref:Uncharacterized protein n=1 Tax=Hymenolepis diminuta TaxID=6216 RepID=A0A564YNZ1_HYMDI|nr:unnamed protein product [Hymenolepis diminuta]
MHHPRYRANMLPGHTESLSGTSKAYLKRREEKRREGVEMRKLVSCFEFKLAKFYEEGERKLMAR